MEREPTTDDCKPQGTQMTLDPYPRINDLNFNGMESTGRSELRHPPSTNMRYSATLYNVEELEQYVHEPVTVLGMADMQSKDN